MSGLLAVQNESMRTSLASSSLPCELWRLICLLLTTVALAACTTTQSVPEVIVLFDDSGSVPDAKVSFKNDIAPLLQTRCVSCHYDEGPLTGLSFQRRSSMTELNGGRRVLVPGDPEKSSLFLVTVLPDYFIEAMPPTGHRLSDRESTQLYRWIDQGADWPEDLVLEPGTAP